MKIAYLLGSYPSLSETFIAREIEGLRAQGLELEVFALEAGAGAHPIPRTAWDKVSRRLGGNEATHWQVVGRRLATYAALQDVTHVHAGWANELAYIAWGLAEEKQLPWSFFGHARDLWVEGGDLAAKLAHARFAASCTQAGVNLLQQHGPADKVLYAPHGLSLEDYPWRSWQPTEPIQILGVGRLVEKKGWNLLLQILPLLNQAVEVRLRLIGEGSQQAALRKQAKALQVEHLVEFSGSLPHGEVIGAMQTATCLVLPSLIAPDGDRDGLANVLLEAAALGLPIVTTDAGAASDFVDETTGLLAKAGDPADLLRAVSMLLAHPDTTRQRCVAARQRVETDFELQRNVLRLMEAFTAPRV